MLFLNYIGNIVILELETYQEICRASDQKMTGKFILLLALSTAAAVDKASTNINLPVNFL